MNKHRKTATFALTAGIALFGLAGCSHAQGQGPYAGKTAAWFHLHPGTAAKQLNWCKKHITKAEWYSNTYVAKHYPSCFDAYWMVETYGSQK